MSSRFRTGMVILFGGGLIALMGVEVWRWGGGLIRLPIPIGGAAGLPVPLVSWLGIAVYTACFESLFSISPGTRWGAAVRLGLVLHALMLLARQASYMASVPPVELGSWYLRYWQAVWAATLAGGMAGMIWFIGCWRRTRMADPWLFLSPWLGGYAMLWVTSWHLAPGLILWATLAGVGLFGASRLPVLGAGWAQLRNLAGKEGVFLVLVFLAALALRLFYTARVMTNPDFLNTGSDGPTYDALAWALAQGQPTPESAPWWSTHDHFFAPGYVRFVTLIYGLVGRSYFAVCAVQAVMGATACALMYAVAKWLFGRPVARIASVFGVLNFPMIFAVAAIGHQAMDLFWTLLVVWCLIRYLEDPQRWGRWIVGIGLLLGWAALTREGNIVFWLFLLGWFLLGVRLRVGWRPAILHAAALSLGFLVVLLPFIWDGGEGIFDRLGHLWFLYEHTSTHINTWFNPWRNPDAAWALFQGQPLNVMVKVGEAMVGNFNTMFLNQDYGSFDPVFLVRGSPYYYGMWFYALSLAFFGLGVVCWGAFRRPVERLDWWLIIVLLASRTAVHLVLTSAYRYRVPLEPYLIMLAAVGLTQLLSAARDRRGRVTPRGRSESVGRAMSGGRRLRHAASPA